MTASELRAYVLARVRPGPAGCLWWTGYLDRHGYGRAARRTGEALAHRLAYRVLVGDPDGFDITTTCGHRRCCAPAHLALATTSETVARGRATIRAKRGDVCSRGHVLDYTSPAGRRGCRICRQAAVVRYRARKRASL